MRGSFIFVAAVLSFCSVQQCSCGSQEGRQDCSSPSFCWTFEKCFEGLGCFCSDSPFFATTRPTLKPPDSREDIGTTFHLYTRKNPATPLVFNNTDRKSAAIEGAGFKPSLRTIFLVSGFINDMAPVWREPMKDEILKVEDCNVIVADWTNGSGPVYNYDGAAANARVVGAEIADLITFLQESLGLKPEKVYMIGYSLGAHVAGYTGKRIKNLGRITGLDPAGPYFEDVDPCVRLDSTDALLVDVIHTDAAYTGPMIFSSFTDGYGTTEKIGDLDFFVNGGTRPQPNCPSVMDAIQNYTLTILSGGTPTNAQTAQVICSHHRAVDVMFSSITHRNCLMGAVCDSWESFRAGKCGSCKDGTATCVELGFYADAYKRSKAHLDVYVKTDMKSPYCL